MKFLCTAPRLCCCWQYCCNTVKIGCARWIFKQGFSQPDLYAMVDGWRSLNSSSSLWTLVNIKSRGIVKHCLQVWGQLPTSGECPHVTDVLSRYLIQIILMIIGFGDWWGPALRARGRTSQTAKHHQCHGGRLPWSFPSVISCPGPGLALRHASCPDIWRYDGCQLYW